MAMVRRRWAARSMFGVLVCCLAAVATWRAHAEPLRLAAKLADVALDQCKSYHNDTPQAADPEVVATMLGLSKQQHRPWSAGRVDGDGRTDTFHYLIPFRREVSLGTVFIPRGHELRLLKATAPFPGDPSKEAHWTVVAPLARQSGAELLPLPPGTKTRALLTTERLGNGRYSSLGAIRLFSERVHNVTPEALAYADHEYKPPQTDFIPNLASNITSGTGHWVNVGKNQSGFIPAPPIGDTAPAWFMLSWQQEQTLTGLWLQSNIDKIEVETFTGPANVNPRAGTPSEWRRLRNVREQVEPVNQMYHNSRWISFEKPVTTRGLRLVILKTGEGPVANITGLHALVDLGDRPVPARGITSDEPPPFRFAYQMPQDGNVTLAVNHADGRRARNLVVRTNQTKGEHPLGWDLKDEQGNYVAPGTYRWTGLTWPDIQVRYEATLYPNVSRHAPENSPWLNGQHGSGGWLADHTPPVGCCVAGDRVYLSAYVAESGVSFIECDLEGRKRWGYHSFAAWTGPRYLASDGKDVFVGAPVLGTSTEGVWAVDIESKKVRSLLSLTPTANRRRGIQGLAARDGKLYMSINGTESWLVNAASADDADIMSCIPLYPEQRKPRVAYEVVPDPRGDFLRLFRLQGTPPGGATQFTLNHLETQGGTLPQQHIVLAFKRPVPLGSLVYPVPQDPKVRVLLSVLKPDAPYPPNPEQAAHWQPLANSGKAPWDVVPTPPGTLTRALRVSFVKGNAVSEDPLDKVLDKPKTADDDFRNLDKAKPKAKDVLTYGEDRSVWKGRLEGMKLLRRRFVNVAPEATVRVSSGKVAADGTWDAQRSTVLTETDPAVYTLEWKAEQSLRGLAVREIDGELTKVDVFTGRSETINPADAKGWETVAEYRQERRDHHSGFPSCNASARYVDGYIDFGKDIKTRAVRLRVVKQWVDNLPDSRGVRDDQGGTKLDQTRCRIYGVAALKYLGGEVPFDPAALERIEVYDVKSAKLIHEVDVEKPGEIALNPAGSLHAISGNKVVRVDDSKGQHQPLVSDLEAPTDLAFDRQGNLYVFDGGKDRQQVRVYDPAGKYLRSIGTAGGLKAGAWDATRMGTVTAIDVDHKDQLWVVENQYHPKRITVWSCAGELKKELLGNTAYGGGGVIDPWDKSRLFYGPLEFELDWKTGLSKLKNLTWTGATPAGEQPIRVGDRQYMVTRTAESGLMQCAVVYLYEKDHLKPAAAMGLASAFPALKTPEMMLKLGSPPLTQRSFLWSDRNGDGEVQAEEVSLAMQPQPLTDFNRDLGVQGGTTRYQVKEILPNGVPIYERKEFPALKGRYVYQLSDGTFYRLGESTTVPEGVVKADGTQVWSYAQEGGPGVQALHHARAWRTDQVIAQFGLVGHETAHAGDLGEFVVVHGNTGAWNIWTRDGLLVGPLFRDWRTPKARPWSMSQHDRGMMLPELTVGEEHFSGYMCRSVQDNKYYAVAGHNHLSVVEILGLDQFRRLNGELTVTADDIRKAQEWESRRQKSDVYVRAPVIDVYRMRKPPELDGKLSGWGAADADIPEGAEFRVTYDDKDLYLAYRVRSMGPLKNTGHEWDRLFKTGAALDLHLATNPDAKPDRQAPEAGDLRVLLTYMDNKPAAVLYRPVVPGTPPEKAWRVTSPVATLTFDEVAQIKGVRMAKNTMGDQYVLEAAIPLSALGLKPAEGLRLKMDWGVLVAGPDGHEVIRRVYWANQSTQIVSDAPSEARLTPHLWGHIVFHGVRAGVDEKFNAINVLPDKNAPKEVKKDVGDILDDLKPGKK